MKWTSSTIDRVFCSVARVERPGWRISVVGGMSTKDGIAFGCTIWKGAHVRSLLLCQMWDDGCQIHSVTWTEDIMIRPIVSSIGALHIVWCF